MFTGIVEETGTVAGIHEICGGGVNLTIRSCRTRLNLRRGESIAVNGTCLTGVSICGEMFTVDCSPETLRRTAIGDLRLGKEVHLELPLLASDRLGGHIVQGHVDGTGRVVNQKREGKALIVAFTVPPEVAPYLVPKGSVAVDGVSLTVVECSSEQFTVALIPYTLAVTRFGQLVDGERVNLEADILAKYAAKAMEVQSTRAINTQQLV